MRWQVDSSWIRANDGARSVLGGSPLRLFRLTEAGAAVADRVERGAAEHSRLTDRLLEAGAIHPIPEAPAEYSVEDVTIVTPQLGGTVAADGRVTVDDGSDPPVTGATVRLEQNAGPAAARNVGRSLALTPLLAFIDADVGLPGDRGGPLDDESWWAPLIAQFDDPKVALVAPRVVGDDASSLDLGPESARIRSGTRVGYVPAAAILVRAAAFDAVGGFDETLRVGEDVDFVWRLDQAGWRCRYDTRRSVHHRPRPSLPARLRQQTDYGSSSAPLALRHPTRLAPTRSDAWTAASWVLVGIGHPLFGAVLAAASGVRAARRLPDLAPTEIARLTLVGQLSTGRSLARAVRSAWWPIVLVGSLGSRRLRRIGLLALLANPRRVHLDMAFGWGLWRSMIRHREWRPIVPRITRHH